MSIPMQEEDPFAAFPDHLLHKIMSYLSPKDVGRTSVLSASWNSTWESFPEFVIDKATWEDAIPPERTTEITAAHEAAVDGFLSSMRAFVERHGGGGGEDSTIMKFHLFLSNVTFRQFLSFHPAITRVLNGGVQDFKLQYEHDVEFRYLLPETIFAARSLRTLDLSGCQLSALLEPFPTTFGSRLRQLKLEDVGVDDPTLQGLLSNCHDLEELAIIRCRGFSKLNVSAGLVKLHSLDLDIHEYELNSNLSIDAPNLRRISLTYPPWKIHAWFKNLKSLSLTMNGCGVADTFSLADLKLGQLEDLELVKCSNMHGMNIESKTLRRLSFIDCFGVRTLRIEAQLLDYFKYEGLLYKEDIDWVKVSDELKIDLSMSYYGEFSSFVCLKKVAQLLGNPPSCKIILSLTCTADNWGPLSFSSDEGEAEKTVFLSRGIEQLRMKMVGSSSTHNVASIVEEFLQISYRPSSIFIQVETTDEYDPIFLKVDFRYEECCNDHEGDSCGGGWRCSLAEAAVAGNSEVVMRKDAVEVGEFLKEHASCLKKIRVLYMEGKVDFLA